MKKYLSVYEKFRKEITLQKYAFGAKLPSKRAIAENLGVSVITVEHALELLCSEGYVSSKERSGYFAAYRNDLYGSSDSVRLTAGGFALLAHLAGLESLGVSYLAPFSDARAARALLRPRLKRQTGRDPALRPQDLRNQGEISE